MNIDFKIYTSDEDDHEVLPCLKNVAGLQTNINVQPKWKGKI